MTEHDNQVANTKQSKNNKRAMANDIKQKQTISNKTKHTANNISLIKRLAGQKGQIIKSCFLLRYF